MVTTLDKVAVQDPTASKFMPAYRDRYHKEALTFSALTYDAVYKLSKQLKGGSLMIQGRLPQT